MNNHLSEIAIFELSNQLIDDKHQLIAFNEHLTSCSICQQKVAVEKALSKIIQHHLSVTPKIDVSEKILNHFQPQKRIVFVDLKWLIYASTSFAVIYFLSTIPNFINVEIPKTERLNVIMAAIFLILMADAAFNYLKIKKKQHSA